jgi:hypothetical protein
VVREAMTALPNAAMSWELLAVTSTFAGNLTLLGSVAQHHVAEKSREFGVLVFGALEIRRSGGRGLNVNGGRGFFWRTAGGFNLPNGPRTTPSVRRAGDANRSEPAVARLPIIFHVLDTGVLSAISS